MMGPGFGEQLYKEMFWFIVAVIVAAFASGALMVWGLPKLWQLIKPWIHSVTG